MTQHKGSQANAFHRDASRVIEAHPQTRHKVDLMDVYYGQHPEILIKASKQYPNMDTSHIWLIEVCAGAGTYLSADHPSGYIDGCALRACAKAKEIQRRNPDVTMHVVLVEPDPGYCAELGRLIRPYVDASGRDRVDVKIESARFEDCVERIVAETARPAGGYYFSLWFIDPDGIVEIPHAALSSIAKVRRGPEIIINLSATGLFRVKSAATLNPGDWEHASVAGNRKLMNKFFGDDSWQAVPSESSHAISLGRLANTYADTFPTFGNRAIYKLRTNGDEVRYLIHLSHSHKAIEAFAKTYKSSQQIGLQKGNKLTEPERAKYAKSLVEKYPLESLTIEEMFVEFSGQLNKLQIATICRYADMKGYGEFDDSSKRLTLYEKQKILVERHLPTKSANDSGQTSLFQES